jgi:hypothetical protein
MQASETDRNLSLSHGSRRVSFLGFYTRLTSPESTRKIHMRGSWTEFRLPQPVQFNSYMLGACHARNRVHDLMIHDSIVYLTETRRQIWKMQTYVYVEEPMYKITSTFQNTIISLLVSSIWYCNGCKNSVCTLTITPVIFFPIWVASRKDGNLNRNSSLTSVVNHEALQWCVITLWQFQFLMNNSLKGMSGIN